MFEVDLGKSASKFVKKLDKVSKKRVVNALLEIAEDPYQASNVKRLTGHNAYRKRIGDIRIVYEVYNTRAYVYVIDIGYRGSIYKNLQ